MAIGLLALNYVDINNFMPTERLELQQGNGGTYQVQLVQYKSATVAPPAGGPFQYYSQNQLITFPTRYLPPVGSTVQIVFPRAASVAANPSNQDTSAPCTPVDARDGSVLQFTLTSGQVDKIVSEGVQLKITLAGVTKSYPINHFVLRRSNAPGA